MNSVSGDLCFGWCAERCLSHMKICAAPFRSRNRISVELIELCKHHIFLALWLTQENQNMCVCL